MRRRTLYPHLVLAVMTLLAIGAAILGFEWAPNSTDLAVHNAAGETLKAQTVAGTYTTSTLHGESIQFLFKAPSTVTAHFTGPVKGVNHKAQTTTGAAAANVLSPVRELGTVSGFTGHGSVYLASETIKNLVTPTVRSSVSGTLRAVATVATGYVVRVQEHISATQGGRHINQLLDYRLNRVDAWNRS
jgi:hypothetical protein